MRIGSTWLKAGLLLASMWLVSCPDPYIDQIDMDGDGHFAPGDCNDDDATIHPSSQGDRAVWLYADGDQDGYGDPGRGGCYLPEEIGKAAVLNAELMYSEGMLD